MELMERWKSKTPKFWKKIQRVGILAGAIGGVLIAAPIALPASLVAAGGYMVLAGGLTATLSQLTREDNESK